MHSFVLSISDSEKDSTKCAKCKRSEIDHTDKATCETCPNVGRCELYPLSESNTIALLCPSCIRQHETARMSPEAQEQRVKEMNDRSKRDSILHSSIPDAQKALDLIGQSQKIDNSIQTRSDIFNAETVAIVDLKNAIDSDVSVTNKHFKLAEVLTERRNHFKKVIFDLSAEMVEKSNRQQAIQVYLNELSSKLRVEEREKIKLADINYSPLPVKISKPKGVTVKKFDKSELRKWAMKLNEWAIEHGHTGVPESVLQIVCIQKGMTPEQAFNQMKIGFSSVS